MFWVVSVGRFFVIPKNSHFGFIWLISSLPTTFVFTPYAFEAPKTSFSSPVGKSVFSHWIWTRISKSHNHVKIILFKKQTFLQAFFSSPLNPIWGPNTYDLSSTSLVSCGTHLHFLYKRSSFPCPFSSHVCCRRKRFSQARVSFPLLLASPLPIHFNLA